MQIILSDFMSLDGVAQAPGGREEDTDGGFATAAGRCRTSTRRPWVPSWTKSWRRRRRCCSAGALGRRWRPPGPPAPATFADRTNEIPKYVASRTLTQTDLTWSGSTLLPADDVIGAVGELRARDGKGLQVMGSAPLAAQLSSMTL